MLHRYLSLCLLATFSCIAQAEPPKLIAVPPSFHLAFSAVTDLSLSDGIACGQNNGKQRIITNGSTTARIVATIATTSPTTGFGHYTSSRSSTRYGYPRTRKEMLSPGESRVLGCSEWNVRSMLIHQDFALTGAYYVANDITFPKNENPFDFAIILSIKHPDCDSNGQGGKMEFMSNTHPNRRIEVSWESVGGRGTDGSGVVLEPQGHAESIGCSGFENRPFLNKISAAKFVP